MKNILFIFLMGWVLFIVGVDLILECYFLFYRLIGGVIALAGMKLLITSVEHFAGIYPFRIKK